MSVSYYKSPLKHDAAARCHSLAAESAQAVRRRKREDCHPPNNIFFEKAPCRAYGVFSFVDYCGIIWKNVYRRKYHEAIWYVFYL